MPACTPRGHITGFSLVELMVAMLMSLLLGVAAISVFVSNQRVYNATEGLGRIQENSRVAFELMARDIREAGGNPCDVRMEVVNVLSDVNWWATYEAGIEGLDDGSHPDSAGETDAIRIQYFQDTGLVTSGGMGGATGQLPVTDSSRILDRQILMACGFFPTTTTEQVADTAAIFSAGKTASAITHAQASGNTRDDFTDAGNPTAVTFPAGTILGTLRAMEWFVGDNDRGGRSLFRRQLRYSTTPGTAPALGPDEEVVDDVVDLQLTYLDNGTWTEVGEAPPANWNRVTAVQVALVLQARDSRSGGVDGNLITRRMSHVVALRNKL